MNVPPGSVPQVIARLATKALIAEASLSPKPGLVTPHSLGAHRDMDFHLFVVSAKALEPCFAACATAGEAAARRGISHGVLLRELRTLGQAGEQAMLHATSGVNTHKGAIFCLGLLSAALADLLSPSGRQHNEQYLGDHACDWVARLCSGLVERELFPVLAREPATAGERMFRDHGARGARGQAQDGFPLLKGRLLPLLRAHPKLGSDAFAQACLEALVLSMSELEDSCLLSRGGRAGLELVRLKAAHIYKERGLRQGRDWSDLHELDANLCRQGLSPGGSADMVAAGIFLILAERHQRRG